MAIKRKFFLATAFVLLVFMVLLHSCVTFRMSPKKIDEYFKKHNVQGSQHHYTVGTRDVHYVQAGDTLKPLVLFVHGSPGSLSAFIHFLVDSALLERALLISADRPGFGYSNFGRGESSLKKQGETLKPILEKHKNNRPIILVGHSLAGALIAQMAVDCPELVDGLIIVAGSIDPDLEPNETWFRAPLATPFLKWLVPASFRASNTEIYKLKPQLQQLVPLWKNITCPVIVIQGKKDFLVPYENVAFAKRMLVNAPVEYVIIDDMNHFVPWSNPELIREAVLKIINREALH